jgi:hypothetical protein
LDSRSRFVHRRYYWLHRRVHGRDGVGNGVNRFHRADCRRSIEAHLVYPSATARRFDLKQLAHAPYMACHHNLVGELVVAG